MGVTVEELKQRFVGRVFDTMEVVIEQERILAYARGCGETDPRYVDPEHEDFQAPVNYCAHFHGARLLPSDLPGVDTRRMIDASKVVEWIAPIRVGDAITGRSQLHDVYEKSGRSGMMLFLVHRMEFSNQRSELVARVDWRLLFRGGLS